MICREKKQVAAYLTLQVIRTLKYTYNKITRLSSGEFLKTYIESRVLENARYIVEHNCTVRECAKKMGTSKSTVHKDVSQRIWGIDRGLALAVRKVLNKNKSERHIRGGMATKRKKALLSNSKAK